MQAIHRDEGGAVMVVGLFMALGVIAATWSVIGIGDAIIARDRAQEAVDSAAYTNAVIHARGMNFISLINIVVMSMCMIYLFLSWMDLLLSLVLMFITGITTGPNHCAIRYVTWLTGGTVDWCSIAATIERIEAPLLKFDERFFRLFKRVSPPLFETQVYAAMVVPYLGSLAALDTGRQYGKLTISGSFSNVPGGGARPPLNKLSVIDRLPFLNVSMGKDRPTANAIQDRRIGLPVEAEPAYFMCVRGTRFILEFMKDSAGAWGIGGKTLASWTSMEPLSTILYGVFQSAGELNRMLFCSEKAPKGLGKKDTPLSPEEASVSLPAAFRTGNREALRYSLYWGLIGSTSGSNSKFYLKEDPFWRLNWPDPSPRESNNTGYFSGPKRVANYAYNGTDWMQIWTAAPVSNETDEVAAVVSLPSRIFGRLSGTQGTSGGVSPTGAPPRPTGTPSPIPTAPTSRPSPGPPGTPQPAPGPAPTPPGDSVPMRWFSAQSEFYFDCPTVWQSSRCNKGSAALYQLKWRARLRRVHDLNLAADLVELAINNFLFGTVFKTKSKEWLEKALPNEIIREGAIKALRNDAAKILNHRFFTGDQSSREILH